MKYRADFCGRRPKSWSYSAWKPGEKQGRPTKSDIYGREGSVKSGPGLFPHPYLHQSRGEKDIRKQRKKDGYRDQYPEVDHNTEAGHGIEHEAGEQDK